MGNVKLKLWPDDKIKRSLKLFKIILMGTWMPQRNFMTIQLTFVEIFQSGDISPQGGSVWSSQRSTFKSSTFECESRLKPEVLWRLSQAQLVVAWCHKGRLSCPLPPHLPHQHVCADCSSQRFNCLMSRLTLTSRNSTLVLQGHF